MACYHPLKGFPVGYTQNGKTKYKVTEYAVKSILKYPDGVLVKRYDDSLDHMPDVKLITDFQELPCGTCKGCRMAASRAWADRCVLEAQDHKSNVFLTLTYDDEHLEHCPYGTDENGEAFVGLHSLVKKDLQSFHKNLRNELNRLHKIGDDRCEIVYDEKIGKEIPKIRFFACGEYGDDRGRCHFHDIIFGLTVPDKRFYRVSSSGYNVFKSDWLKSIWKNGDVYVGAVTWSTCAYTSRYVMKKIGKGANDYYTRHNLVPPFVVMSRRPGIAYKYYETHPNLFNFRTIAMTTDSGSHAAYPPRYFKKHLEKDDPDKYNELREMNNRTMEIKKQSKLAQTDLEYLDLLKAEEDSFNRNAANLKRKEF